MSPNQLLLKFALRYPGWIVLTVILGFSGALFNGVSTTLIVPVLLGLLGQEIGLQGAPPIIQRPLSLFQDAAGENNLILMAGAILLAIILKNVAGYANSLASNHLSRSLVNDIRKEGLALLLEVDLDFYAKTRVGDIINCISREVSQTANAIRIGIQMLTTAITILVFVALLLAISWQLTLVSTTLLFLVALINQYFIKRAKEFGALLSDLSRAYSVTLLEVLNGIRLVKATGHELREYEKLEKLIHERERADLQSQAIFAVIGPINEVTGILTLLAIVALGRIFFAEQIESLSAILLTYLVILFRLLPFISQLNGFRSGFANTAPSVEIVANFLNRDDKPFMPTGSVPYTKLKRGIGFDHVGFTYPGHNDSVLRGVNLWVPQGTTLALVGASGAGKSTLADLAVRFHDPTTGRITIDDQDLRDYNLRSLRQAMGIVSQDTFLFNDSVRNNIAYACEAATEEEVIAAAKRANAYEFIIRLPQGFDTPIGDRGVLLSGGQRQRIAIARALLRDPDILILDEATSALDTASERLVQQAIDELSRDRTTIVIAHRLSTVQKAHQIAVLDKGKVVEVGSHEELLKKGGYYTRLHSLQFSEDAQEVPQVIGSETLMQSSYEIRTRLNSIIGSLKFLIDGLVDSSEERSELTEAAYHSAINLLKTLEFLEESLKLQMK